jgi:hypothetical protein
MAHFGMQNQLSNRARNMFKCTHKTYSHVIQTEDTFLKFWAPAFFSSETKCHKVEPFADQ